MCVAGFHLSLVGRMQSLFQHHTDRGDMPQKVVLSPSQLWGRMNGRSQEWDLLLLCSEHSRG